MDLNRAFLPSAGSLAVVARTAAAAVLLLTHPAQLIAAEPPPAPSSGTSRLLTVEGTPAFFTMDAQGGLSCEGTREEACAFYDELKTPLGPRYVVQGSFSRRRHPSDKSVAAEYINYYFALFCRRDQNRLIPLFSFLEGRERLSDLHFNDLDGDGTLEVIVTAVFGPHGAYASVYRLDGRDPARIFYHSVNSAQADFEVKDGIPVLTFERRDPADRSARREVYRWNGSEFLPQL